jgi:uncharacterized paraquat-inducible protein A
MGASTPDEAKARSDAYKASLCVDCKTVPYSAGRPRCETCHMTHLARGGEHA